MSRSPQDLRPGRPQGAGGPGGAIGPDRNWRWAIVVLLALLFAVIVLPNLVSSPTRSELSYADFTAKVTAKPPQIRNASVNNDSGKITGELADDKKTKFSVNGPKPVSDDEI